MGKKIALLTAIIPVKNIENISKNICELFTQDLSEIRIIIVLDDVDESTKKIIRNLKESNHACDITILEGKFGNPGGARNAGMALPESDWICFWDADDQPAISNILREIRLDSSNSEVIVGQFATMDWMTNTEIGTTRLDLNLYAVAMNPGLWRHVFRREILEQLAFPEFRMAEDQVFLAKVYDKCPTVKFSESIFYYYFKNVPNQLTSRNENLDDIEKSLGILLNLRGRDSKFFEILLVRQLITVFFRKFSYKRSRLKLYQRVIFQISGSNLAKIFWTICLMKFRRK